ncbi:hypothetical protein AAC03nite_20900 [Alicyclobacillus acidoterrestris]|nr:hypothetical protein AAC03nite_20900 [Alicyclobacillus acidoterrestris]
MMDLNSIVQVLVLYVTVSLGVLLYTMVLKQSTLGKDTDFRTSRQIKNLTLLLIGVITMIFGVGFLHEIWPQYDVLWLPILGILIVAVAWTLFRLRRLSPNTN